jgi:hypothetical protein
MSHQLIKDASRLHFEAAKVADIGGAPVAAGFAYSVRVVAKSAERRTAHRRRTRLRSGKILDIHNEFLIECQVYDRPEMGARVRLLGEIPAQSVIRLYQDDTERLFDARIVWRRGFELGLCFVRRGGARRISRVQLICLRNSYYAIDR